MHAIALALHLLAATLWVGGMFFAYMVLRPVAETLLAPPQRLPLWNQTFARFFRWVWVTVIALLASGYFMAYARYGSQANFPLHIQLMQGLGILMMLVFSHCYFAPFRRLRLALGACDLPEAGRRQGQIRTLVGCAMQRSGYPAQADR